MRLDRIVRLSLTKNLTYTEKNIIVHFLSLSYPGYGGLSWDRSLLSHRRREQNSVTRFAGRRDTTIAHKFCRDQDAISIDLRPHYPFPPPVHRSVICLCVDWPSRRSSFTWLRTTIHRRWSETAHSSWFWPCSRSTRKLYTGRHVLTVSISPLRDLLIKRRGLHNSARRMTEEFLAQHNVVNDPWSRNWRQSTRKSGKKYGG